MPSIRSELYVAWFRLSRNKRDWLDAIKLHRSIRTRQRPGNGRPPESLGRHHDVQELEIGGFPCYTVRPKTAVRARHVLYLHGGAYVHPPETEHWDFAGRIATELACTVSLPLYPLAPHYRYDRTLAVVSEVYEHIAAAVEPADLAVMGDSAGGGMTLVLAQQLKAAGRAQPANLVLLCPWLDITMRDPAIATIDRRDPYLSTPGLIEAARLYSGSLDPADPRVSPLNGDLDGLGRLSVFAGTRDVLFGDARRLWLKARNCGVEIDYFEYEDMFHGWMLEHSIPEARRARRQIVEILGGHQA